MCLKTSAFPQYWKTNRFMHSFSLTIIRMSVVILFDTELRNNCWYLFCGIYVWYIIILLNWRPSISNLNVVFRPQSESFIFIKLQFFYKYFVLSISHKACSLVGWSRTGNEFLELLGWCRYSWALMRFPIFI